jgi:hypothetical protein
MNHRRHSVQNVCRSALATAWVAVLVHAGCAEIWGISPRDTDPNLVCSEGQCLCAEGHADCDGDPVNGCEANLSDDLESCGGCGQRCDNGTCAGGACLCEGPFLDCDGVALNGCESDIRSDATNCGVCGHDCFGGGCESRRCLPATLAEGEFDYFLLLHDGWLYAGMGQLAALGRVSVVGGALQPAIGDLGPALGAALEGGTLYWTSAQNLYKTSLDSLHSELLHEQVWDVGELHSESQLAAGGGYVYASVLRPDGHVLLRTALPGAADETVLWTDDFSLGLITRVIADETRVYFGSGSGIHAIPHGAVDPTLSLAEVGEPSGLTTAGGFLYWSGSPANAIYRVPVAGGEPAHVVDAVDPQHLAADASHVYWANGVAGRIYRAPNDGSGEPEVLATDQVVIATAIDDEALYWVTKSRIMKLAK